VEVFGFFYLNILQVLLPLSAATADLALLVFSDWLLEPWEETNP
jgi:hypothetical protein